jgi:hypothetical protein
MWALDLNLNIFNKNEVWWRINNYFIYLKVVFVDLSLIHLKI